VFEIKEILDLAIRLEKTRGTYRQAILTSSNAELKAALDGMAQKKPAMASGFQSSGRLWTGAGKNPFLETMSGSCSTTWSAIRAFRSRKSTSPRWKV